MHSEGWSPFSYWWYSPLLIDAHLPAPIPLAPCTAAPLRQQRPSGRRFAKHGLSNPPPQTPWSRRDRQGKTMLRTPATAGTDTAITTPAQRPCLSELLPRLPRSSGMGGAHPTKAAKVLSMVFDFTAPNPLEIHPARTKDHAYLNCYSTGDIIGNAGAASTTAQHT